MKILSIAFQILQVLATTGLMLLGLSVIAEVVENTFIRVKGLFKSDNKEKENE